MYIIVSLLITRHGEDITTAAGTTEQGNDHHSTQLVYNIIVIIRRHDLHSRNMFVIQQWAFSEWFNSTPSDNMSYLSSLVVPVNILEATQVCKSKSQRSKSQSPYNNVLYYIVYYRRLLYGNMVSPLNIKYQRTSGQNRRRKSLTTFLRPVGCIDQVHSNPIFNNVLIQICL